MDPSKSFDDSWRSKNSCILYKNWHFALKMVKKVRKAGFCNDLYKKLWIVFMLDLVDLGLMDLNFFWVRVQIKLET